MSRNSRNPISWVPTVYFAMGLPFVVLNMVSVLMFKGLGIDDAQIALWTSLIMLPKSHLITSVSMDCYHDTQTGLEQTC